MNSLHGSSRVGREVVGKSLSQEGMFRAIYPGSTHRRVDTSEVCLIPASAGISKTVTLRDVSWQTLAIIEPFVLYF